MPGGTRNVGESLTKTANHRLADVRGDEPNRESRGKRVAQAGIPTGGMGAVTAIMRDRGSRGEPT